MTVTIQLERDCGCTPDCSPLAERLYEQLASGNYSQGASVVEIPPSKYVDVLLSTSKTVRKRATKALDNGYRFEVALDRLAYVDDVFEINTSAPRRQGRPMTAAYRERPSFTPIDYACTRHGLHTYGVLDQEQRLRAYSWVYRCGQLVMISTILGHADHLERHVMYLLLAGIIGCEAHEPGGILFYNLHDSGGDGLRWFKERFGLRADTVKWQQ